MTQPDKYQRSEREIELTNAIQELIANPPIDQTKLSNLLDQFFEETAGRSKLSPREGVAFPTLADVDEEAAAFAFAKLREQRLEEVRQRLLNEAALEDREDQNKDNPSQDTP
jgi:alkanesulfonate monooxygenase SsuD/methylene tetrahydromethanopterin reductase-like flavin-dependent oxidoreductase (luciferase family)